MNDPKNNSHETNVSSLNFFEGTEKLLEIWFSSTNNHTNKGDLRNVKREQWVELLSHVHCEIISEKEDDHMRAYLLSESSMFVSENRFILKTCGTTTLLHSIKPLLQLVLTECGFDKVDDVFYSRRKFMKPELQAKPHGSFEDEVAFLDELFKDGAAYCLGRMNKDCWYLYTLDRIGVEQEDQTLEILMTELDLSMMQIFSKTKSQSAQEATKFSGIDTLLPGTLIDAYLFDPHGYSMNGILPCGQYFTIHVTPEPECSYVSFESNVSQESYFELITRLLDIFKPQKFLMTIFANKASLARKAQKSLKRLDELQGYKRKDNQLCQFKNYNLTYAHYSNENAPPSPTVIT